MTTCSKTSIVYNQPNKTIGLPPYYYRYRVCDTNLNGNTPADQYQKLKIIQNTVRVYGSLYTANLGPLTAYSKPISNPEEGFYGVCWNQMSDRPVASVQRASVPTGYANSLNNRHHSVTSSKPGSQTPGGAGCDIKHNSYDRYLNRLKGKGPMRRGVIPPTFGRPIKFNPAFPVYGGKTTKTNIVSGCDCPIESPEKNLQQDVQIYNNPIWYPDPSGNCSFKVGDYVYAIEGDNTYYSRAVIINEFDDIYEIEFDDKTIQYANYDELKIYYPCDCSQGFSVSTDTVIVKYSTSDGGTFSCLVPYNLPNNF
jgi:hypothetical protein